MPLKFKVHSFENIGSKKKTKTKQAQKVFLEPRVDEARCRSWDTQRHGRFDKLLMTSSVFFPYFCFPCGKYQIIRQNFFEMIKFCVFKVLQKQYLRSILSQN
jgi:hypothetical protein